MELKTFFSKDIRKMSHRLEKIFILLNRSVRSCKLKGKKDYKIGCRRSGPFSQCISKSIITNKIVPKLLTKIQRTGLPLWMSELLLDKYQD